MTHWDDAYKNPKDRNISMPMDEYERMKNAQEQPTLRDCMAMAALTGLAAADVNDDLTYADLAIGAYKTADLMLKERDKE